MTSKTFFSINSKAASFAAGLDPKASPLPVDSSENTRPFVATLFFLRNAAEKPEAQT